MSGKENFAWYRFDARHLSRSDLSCVWLSSQGRHEAGCVRNAASHIGRSVLTPRFCRMLVGSVPIVSG